MDEEEEQALNRSKELERESLREEIHRKKHEVSQSEKRLKERSDEHFASNLLQMTREAGSNG